ncbi:MAG: branched-chain amino acid ABC transporter permease [Lachnospiraceae bacterium]|nr:branched-chain amino acid ABC transporter permease [Lachnospiraceae bacterium]
MKKLTKQQKSNLITLAMVVCFYLICEIFIRTGLMSSHLKGLLVPLTYYAIAAVGLNLCVGILGELSLGHAGFMCIGAFSSSIFSVMTRDALPTVPRFILAFIIGVAMTALLGFLIGIPVLRLNGDYLAIVTLAFGEIIKNILNAVYMGVDDKGLHLSLKDAASMGLDASTGKKIINGAMGITGTPSDSNFTIAIIILLVSLIIVQNLVQSRDGRAIMSIRDNRIAAESTGINVTKYKMLAFTISAAIAGAAGVLFSHNISTLTAQGIYFGYNASIMLLVYVVLGGIGNIRGSVIAAMILYVLPELLRGMDKYRMLIYSIVLIVMMLFNWSPKAIEFRQNHLSKFSKRFRKEAAR